MISNMGLRLNERDEKAKLRLERIKKFLNNKNTTSESRICYYFSALSLSETMHFKNALDTLSKQKNLTSIKYFNSKYYQVIFDYPLNEEEVKDLYEEISAPQRPEDHGYLFCSADATEIQLMKQALTKFSISQDTEFVKISDDNGKLYRLVYPKLLPNQLIQQIHAEIKCSRQATEKPTPKVSTDTLALSSSQEIPQNPTISNLNIYEAIAINQVLIQEGAESDLIKIFYCNDTQKFNITYIKILDQSDLKKINQILRKQVPILVQQYKPQDEPQEDSKKYLLLKDPCSLSVAQEMVKFLRGKTEQQTPIVIIQTSIEPELYMVAFHKLLNYVEIENLKTELNNHLQQTTSINEAQSDSGQTLVTQVEQPTENRHDAQTEAGIKQPSTPNPSWLLQVYNSKAFRAWQLQLLLGLVTIAAALVMTSLLMNPATLASAAPILADIVIKLSPLAFNAILGTTIGVAAVSTAVLHVSLCSAGFFGGAVPAPKVPAPGANTDQTTPPQPI